MRDRRTLIWLALILAGVTLITLSVVLYRSYHLNLDLNRSRLRELVHREALWLESVWSYDQREGPVTGRSELESGLETLSQARAVESGYWDTARVIAFALAQRRGDRIEFLIRSGDVVGELLSVPLQDGLAEPMRQALAGQTGLLIGPDYRGREALAAFQPVRGTGLGLVAKIDMAELRRPILVAGAQALAVAAILMVAGIVIFYRVANPIVERSQRRAARFRAIVQDQVEVVCRHQPDGTPTFVNAAGYRLFGSDGDSLEATNIYDWMVASDRKAAQDASEALTPEEPIVSNELRMFDAEGREHWFRWSTRGFFDAHGRLEEFQSTGVDFTEERLAQEATRHAESERRELFQRNLTMLRAYKVLSQCNQAVLNANSSDEVLQEICRVLTDIGRFAGALVLRNMDSGPRQYLEPVAWYGIGKDLRSLAARTSDDGDSAFACLGEALENDRIVFRSGRSAGSAVFPREAIDLGVHGCVALPLMCGSKPFGVLALFVNNPVSFDQEELGLMERLTENIGTALEHFAGRAHIELLTTAIDQAHDGISITDREGTIEFANPALCEITGYSEEELLGANPRLFKSGRQSKDFYERMWARLEAGKQWSGTLFNRRKDGTVFEVDEVISPIRNVSGQITHFVGVQRDVSEKRLLERQVTESQKLEAIGNLAGGIAHDFNNMLAAIIGYAQSAREALSQSPGEAEQDLVQVLGAADRAKGLVSRILSFSRRDETRVQSIALVPLLKEALSFIRASLPATIDIDTDWEHNEFYVRADPVQIQQIVINLCTNAMHAMSPDGGLLTLRCRHSASPQGLGEPMDSGHGSVCLEVIDTGTGMSQEVMSRIFEPFFSTKPAEKGTGMGLSVVYGIVTALGGTIDVESVVDEGTRFSVYLPLMLESEVDQSSGESDLAPARGEGRILFADDEVMLTRLYSRTLSAAGYAVDVVNSGRQALDQFEAAPDAYDLLVTDHTMPGMTGIELATRVREMRPDLPVILCSGFLDEATANRANHCGIELVLDKPVDNDELNRAVGRLLATKSRERSPGGGAGHERDEED